MGHPANYFIAQHIPDVFRREPRNVGVFVEFGGQWAARFFGESAPAVVDRRKIKGLQYPGVYAQWIKYWRRTLDRQRDIELIKRTANGNFRVLDGGAVDGVGHDSVDDVLNYVYAMIVSEGGLAEATGLQSDPAQQLKLKESVGRTFRDAGILSDSALTDVPYPIRLGATVQGEVTGYEPAFVQESDRLSIIETADFTKEFKDRARDHAGYMAFMFSDTAKVNALVDPIAIVSYRREDAANRTVQQSLKLLDKTARVVNWLDDDVRGRFIDERIRIARAAA